MKKIGINDIDLESFDTNIDMDKISVMIFIGISESIDKYRRIDTLKRQIIQLSVVGSQCFLAPKFDEKCVILLFIEIWDP